MSHAYFLFAILVMLLALLIWGRWRYDIVALLALLLAVLVGVVPMHNAFLGFGSPAVVTVATVMVMTQAIMQSGILDVLVKKIFALTRNVTLHLVLLCAVTATLSAFMNNVGALALMMPIALESARKNKWSPSLLLMPIAFASVLGGLTTVIGTPPNILVSAYRQHVVGHPYSLFDFTPVGLGIAVCGVLYVGLLGWRLIPSARKAPSSTEDKFSIKEYIVELKVADNETVTQKTVQAFEQSYEGVSIIGIVRNKRKRLLIPPDMPIKEKDILIVEASHEDLKKLIHATKLVIVGEAPVSSETLTSEGTQLMEAVVAPGTRVEGRSSKAMRLRNRYQINLLAISRQGQPFKQRINEVPLQVGDVVLLQGEADIVRSAAVRLGFLPLVERGVQVVRYAAFLPLGIFATAVLLIALGWLPVQIAFALAVLVMVMLNILPVRRVYEYIDWPIIVLLGAIIPLGTAFQSTGGTTIITNGILALAGHFSPFVILGLVLIVTMTLSDVMNNAATAVIMAPIAMSIAQALHANADPFLMAVAVGASSSFLTPIAHQNNTLVLGPGGYKFFDYVRVGLLLEIIVVLVGVPLISWVWGI